MYPAAEAAAEGPEFVRGLFCCVDHATQPLQNSFLRWNLRPAFVVQRAFRLQPCQRTHRERPMRRMTIEQKWHQLSETARDEAEKLPQGKERDALERKARQLETASQLNQWLASSELKPPD